MNTLHLSLKLLLAASSFAVAETPDPNVLFFAVDDLRTEIGCYGATHVQSPRLDALAAKGMLFERAYCQFALCNPSRTTVMTGMRPEQVGVLGNHTHFRDRFPHVATLPQHFRNHGYQSLGIGKIYHGPFPRGASRTSWDTVGDFPSWSKPPIRFGPRYYFTDDAVAYARNAFKKQYGVAEPGPDDWTEKLVFGHLTDSPEGPDNLHYDGKVADAAIQQLNRLKDESFFLAVGFIKPHSPWVAPKKYFDLYDRDTIPLAPNQEFPTNAPQVAGHNSSEPRRYPPAPKQGDYSESVARELRHGYFACVSFIDAQIGRVLDELARLELENNTIVVVWGDHGYHLGEQNLWGKSTCFENAARVPLMIFDPRNEEMRGRTSTPVELVDLYPTLCELAGLSAAPQLAGKSLTPVLRDPNANRASVAFTQYPRGKAMGYSVTDGTYRYTRWVNRQDDSLIAEEFYDHNVDPLETVNLAAVPQASQKLVAPPSGGSGNVASAENGNPSEAQPKVERAELKLSDILAQARTTNTALKRLRATITKHRAAKLPESRRPAPRAFATKSESARPVRVACVGDSITYGFGIADRQEHSYPARLGKFLGDGFKVRNFGINGATALRQGHKPYWEKPPFGPSHDFQPDIVVLNLGANDAIDLNWKHRAEFRTDYHDLIQSYQRLESNPAIYICDLLPMTKRHAKFDECLTNRREMRAMLWDLARELDVSIVDLHSPYKNKAAWLPDGLHPDENGTFLLAGQIYTAITGKTAPELPQTAKSIVGFETSFEKAKPGTFSKLKTRVGTWHTNRGHVEIDDKHSHTGSQCLHIFGGDKHQVELELPAKLSEHRPSINRLKFQAERWTRRDPFQFLVEGRFGNTWRQLYDGTKIVRIGRFSTLVSISLSSEQDERNANAKSLLPDRLRFSCTSPLKSGLLIDDLQLVNEPPAPPISVTSHNYVAPLLVGAPSGPLRRIEIATTPTGGLPVVTEFHVELDGSLDLNDIKRVHVKSTGSQKELRAAGNADCFANAQQFGSGNAKSEFIISGKLPLTPGQHQFWITATLNPTADIDRTVLARCTKVVFADGQSFVPITTEPEAAQRLGVAVRRSQDDGNHTYRIPGLTRTNVGTLIGVYDIRHRSGGDLPGDIDVGMSRSTDGGRTWEPMKVIMDMGDDPAFRYDGIGDPSVLVDRQTNTIWVSATWSHGNRSWVGSQPGMQPVDTGQWILVRSDDDGVTWSKPINITSQVKDPSWCFLLQGPGKGITMADGTLVFPAQFQDTPENKRLPRSTIIYSRDHGKSWQIGTGAFDDTTESQVAEIEPGVLMLNCRYNRESKRVIVTTRDMGKTWQQHATNRLPLIEPRACMASLINGNEILPLGKRFANPGWMLFSNPNSLNGRRRITIKASSDKATTWPARTQLLLDQGLGAGYSCMTMIDEETIGIMYEGSLAHMVFQRVKLSHVTKDATLNQSTVPATGNASKSKTSGIEKRPRNVLLIVSEDNGPELGCYSDPYAQTPRLDRIASESVRFENAFVPYSVCSPSRATIFTGLYPHQNGQIGLATHKFAMYGNLPNMVSLLTSNGYRTGIIGKIHVNPESAFPCDFRAFPGSNFNRRPVSRMAQAAADFMSEDGPFFLMVNFPDAHFPLLRQQDGLPVKPLNADDVRPLPWVGVDNPRLRQFTANYYNCMSRLDTGVGMVLDHLERLGLAENTLVIYLGDHGAQFSRGKTSVYEAGLRIPLIVREPGSSTAGTVRKELVSTIDLLPTVLDWTNTIHPGFGGSNPVLPEALPGRSLLRLARLQQESKSEYWREYHYAFTTGSAPSLFYPQFAIRDARYKLIHSPLRDRPNKCALAYESRMNEHFAAGCMPSEFSSHDAAIQQLYQRYRQPPEFELYDLQRDPHEFENLAESPNHQAIRNRLVNQLATWRRETHEPLMAPTIMQRLTAEHDAAPARNYRKNKSFRWDYLDYFQIAP